LIRTMNDAAAPRRPAAGHLRARALERGAQQADAEATREQQTPVAYLGALLEAEMTERAERRERRRLIDARFPSIKRLQDFRFVDNPNVPQAKAVRLGPPWTSTSRRLNRPGTAMGVGHPDRRIDPIASAGRPGGSRSWSTFRSGHPG
jgi:IstB-like ATP binding protein